MKRNSLHAVAAACTLLVSASAQAAVISLSYFAEVKNIVASEAAADALDDAGIGIGTRADGAVTVDSSLNDSAAGPGIGIYNDAVIALSLSLGGYSAAFSPFFDDVYVLNDGPQDSFLATSEIDFGGPVLGPGLFGLQLRDSSASAFSSDAFPAGPLVLADFDSFAAFDALGTAVLLSIEVNGEIAEIFAEIKTFDATVVPLPAAIWLFGAALAALAGLRQRG